MSPHEANGDTYSKFTNLSFRKVPTEEMISQLVQAVNLIRINLNDPERVPKWSEALEALMDLAEPWLRADKRFEKDWKERPVRVLKFPSGRIIPYPAASDCRKAQEILFAGLANNGLLIHMDKISGPGIEDAERKAEQERLEQMEAEA